MGGSFNFFLGLGSVVGSRIGVGHDTVSTPTMVYQVCYSALR